MGKGEKFVKKVFAVVVTYNGERWVNPCFGSLDRSKYPVEIIVADNGSKDKTLHLIQNKFEKIELVTSPVNVGFGQANNVGINLALSKGADYVFLLNQDAWVEEDTVGKLIDVMETSPEIGILSPLHFSSEFSFDKGFLNCVKKEYQQEDLINSFEKKADAFPKSIDFINAAAWMISRQCIKNVGGFSPLFFQYGEDRDYVNRIHFHGFKMAFVSNCRIFHDRENRDASSVFRSAEKLVWYYRIGMEVRWADVNHSILLSSISSLFWLSTELASHFIKGKFFAFKSFFVVLGQVMSKRKSIFTHRKSVHSKKKELFLN